MKKIIVTTVAALAVAVLAGCGGTPPVEAGQPSASPNKPAPLPTPEPVADESPATPTPEPPSVKAFGMKTTYEDGTEITVAKPTKISLPDYYTWDELGVDRDDVLLIKLTLKVKNGSTGPIDATGASVTVLAGTEGDALEAQCWSEVVTCYTSQDSLRPGRNVTISWAYIVPKSKANLVTVDASPTWEHDAIAYEGALK